MSYSDGDDADDTLHTIDLDSAEQRPKLAFSQVESDEMARQPNMTPVSSNQTYNRERASSAGDTASTVEGTELQSRPRSVGSNASHFKEWGMTQVKITRQMVSERFGRGLKTVDPDLERRLGHIRDMQKKYSHLLSLMGQFQVHFSNVVETQKSLAEHFAFLSVRSPELTSEFQFNSDGQKKMARNAEALLTAVGFFITNVHTMSNKSIEDTLATAKTYESARVLFDANRSELEALKKASATSQAAQAKLPQVKEEFDKCKKKYERLRNDLDIKLKLLDENRLKVLHSQLVLLHGAFAAYNSNNHATFQTLATAFQAHIEELKHSRGRDLPAWLEDLPSDKDQSNGTTN